MQVMMFQSTHSRGVRRILTQRLINLFGVSIHALTRSATPTQLPEQPKAPVSIHALTRSATVVYSFTMPDGKFQSTHSRGVRLAVMGAVPIAGSFNPRTHEECDQYRGGSRHRRAVSIHALTRSATGHDYMYKVLQIEFQSTHSRGVRPRLPKAW